MLYTVDRTSEASDKSVRGLVLLSFAKSMYFYTQFSSRGGGDKCQQLPLGSVSAIYHICIYIVMYKMFTL